MWTKGGNIIYIQRVPLNFVILLSKYNYMSTSNIYLNKSVTILLSKNALDTITSSHSTQISETSWFRLLPTYFSDNQKNNMLGEEF